MKKPLGGCGLWKVLPKGIHKYGPESMVEMVLQTSEEIRAFDRGLVNAIDWEGILHKVTTWTMSGCVHTKKRNEGDPQR